ncbi:MAG: PatB family C-S lyase, partial [Chloroflexota bacterium]
MNYNFDLPVERRNSGSAKWSKFEADVLPMWVADMDFASPQPILNAIHERANHGVFGYCQTPDVLQDAICARVKRLYDWDVVPDEVVFIPGLVSALNVSCRAIGSIGDSVLINTPVYPPFQSSPTNQYREQRSAQQVKTLANVDIDGKQLKTLRYEIEFTAMEAAIQPNTNLFLLCNPHNPTGRAFTRDELSKLAEMCLRHDMIICSDEIHSDLLMGDTKHIPIATLSPEVSDRTITLLSPSKTFNMPSLGCGFAIIQNEELREQFNQSKLGIVPYVNALGYAAATAAFTDPGCEDWLNQLRAYLTANRNYLVNYVEEYLPGVRTTVPEATYLAWMDCSDCDIEGNAQEFFVNEGKVGFNAGETFGPGGEDFVRINYACPRSRLEEGLERMRMALSR